MLLILFFFSVIITYFACQNKDDDGIFIIRNTTLLIIDSKMLFSRFALKLFSHWNLQVIGREVLPIVLAILGHFQVMAFHLVHNKCSLHSLLLHFSLLIFMPKKRCLHKIYINCNSGSGRIHNFLLALQRS